MATFGERLAKSANKESYKRRCDIIYRYCKTAYDKKNKDTIDIPDCCKPKEERFDFIFTKFLEDAVKSGAFWLYYDKALRALQP